MIPVNIKKLNKILFNAKNTLALQETLAYYVQNKSGLTRGISNIFSKIMTEDMLLDLTKVFKIVVKNEKSLSRFMSKFNPYDVKLFTPNKKCYICEELITNSGIEHLYGATHIFCWLEDLMIDKSNENSSEPINKDIKEDIKENIKEKETKIEKIETTFKEGSKYAFVYNQILAGKTKEEITEFMLKEYGEKTASKANMSVYFNTIIKKTGVTIK